MNVSVHGPKVIFTIPIFGGLEVNETLINSWIVIGLIFVLCLILTHKLEKIPKKRTQQLAEKIVIGVDKLVVGAMGERNKGFAPYILTLLLFSVFGSLISLVGLRSVTADINVTLAWALMTFFLMYACGIKAHGIKHFKGLVEPTPIMFPINVISQLATPVSMSVRHFGNIAAGMIITTLLYGGLAAASAALFGIGIPILQVGLPAILSVYFDIFTGFIQAYVFAMLTMVNVAMANEPTAS